MSQNYHYISDSSDSEDSPVKVDIPPSKHLYSDSADSQVKEKGSKKPRKRDAQASQEAKLRKLQKAEEKRQMKYIQPSRCLNYLSINISESLSENPRLSFIIRNLGNFITGSKIIQGEEDSIIWIRKTPSGECVEEPHLLILWDHIKLLSHIGNFTVTSFFSNLKKKMPKYQIYLIIYGLRDFCKRLRKKSTLTETEKKLNIQPSKDMVENVLCELQLITGIQSKLTDDPNELILFINQSTKSVAQQPYREKKQELLVGQRLYLQGYSRNCVKIDKQNFGMKRLWQQQLAQLPKSSLDRGKAISAVYPSPLALYQAYSCLGDRRAREALLQNITVGRAGSTKRLGPEFSKKINLLFSIDGEDIAKIYPTL